MSNLVEIRNLRYRRSNRIIFNGINLDIPKGKVTVVMGPSGTGKTTLLRLIGGQLTPSKGTIKIEGQNIPTMSRQELFMARRKMGILFQTAALFTDINVFNNVAYPLREHTDLPEEMIRDLVLMKLQAVGLRGARDLMPAELSGGMARRVALARAIALDPTLIMYDEPFAGQDPTSMGVLVKLIRLLNDALGLTTIVVSHDVAEAMSIADYVCVIAEGNVIGHGTPEMLTKSQSGWVKQFMQGLPDGPVPFHYPAPNYIEDLLEGGC